MADEKDLEEVTEETEENKEINGSESENKASEEKEPEQTAEEKLSAELDEQKDKYMRLMKDLIFRRRQSGTQLTKYSRYLIILKEL